MDPPPSPVPSCFLAGQEIGSSTPPAAGATATPSSPARPPRSPVGPSKIHGSPSSIFGQETLICSPEKSVNTPGSQPVVPAPMELLLKGEEQMVAIPLKTILVKFLGALPSKIKPRLDCKKLGPVAFQAVAEFDVSWAKYSVDPPVKVARMVGEVCSSPPLALSSACRRAFDYLADKHFICVEDYSSKIIDCYENDGVGLAVNSTLYLLEEVLGKWSFALDGISEFHDQLEMKELAAKGALTKTEAPVIYGEAKKYIESFLTKYTAKHRACSREFKVCQTDRNYYLKKSEEKYSHLIRRGLKETVRFNEKDVLDYVLSYLGLGEADYSNEPVDGDMFIGEVKISLPYIEGARYGGRTTFHSGHLLSAFSAEQDAAFKALRFMEKELKITIGDMNYHERVETKERHNSTASLLQKIFDVAEAVKKEWDLMETTMKCGLDVCEVRELSSSAMVDDEVEALKFCASASHDAYNAFIDNFNAALVKIKQIERYIDNLSDVEDY